MGREKREYAVLVLDSIGMGCEGCVCNISKRVPRTYR